ncbi:phosphoglycolate phosphatase [Luteimonas pelagia]
MPYPKAVLFDLDGTLLDSAPDMAVAISRLRGLHGRDPMPLDALRPHVSRGARAMAAAAFPDLDEAARDALIPPFLDLYREELGRHCAPFDGVERLLRALDEAGTLWGIVTNKPEWLATPLIPMLGWEGRCGVLLGGDSLPARKPDPLPLRVAAERLGVATSDCVYVGDDKRDIDAARAAGMPSVVALWGYRVDGDDPASWRGDRMVDLPADLLAAAAWPRMPA